MQPSVLLADDDKVAREIYDKFFSRAGWSYDIVSDGRGALDAIVHKEYDVILTDLMMPGVDGFELLRTLRQQKPNQAVIVVTGAANVRDVITSLREGASDILLKPIDYDTLRRSVERTLQSTRQRESEDKRLYRFVESEESCFVVKASDLASMRLTLGIVDRLYKSGSIEKLMALRLHLAVQEALTNSLDHGTLELESSWKEEFNANGEDKFSQIKSERLKDPTFGDRVIRITSRYKDKKLEISIRDPGKGFSITPAPIIVRDEEAKLKCHGRGLAIIAGTMDEIRYAHNGSEIIMTKIFAD